MHRAVLFLAAASALSLSTSWAETRPHIIMMMADDLGWNDVGFNGGKIKTPNMDALARNGIILNNYYTAPNCGPSRAQFLTGKYLTHLGLQHKNLQPCRPSGIPLSVPTIADELRLMGYGNHLIGKWHGGFHTSEYLPTNRGFHSFRGMLNGVGDHFRHTKKFQGVEYLDFYNDTIPYTGAYGVYSTDYFKRRALEVIDEHDRSGQPMFMFLSFQAPHTPNQAPQELLDEYPDIHDESRKKYAAMVTGMDQAIGVIVADLMRRNMYNNTVIVLSTDNGGQSLSGGASNYPLRGNKGTYYEAGIKGVAVVSSPLASFVGRSEALVHITDWVPTFIHLAGGRPIGHDGINQWETLSTGNTTGGRTEIIYNIDPLTVASRSSRRAARREMRAMRKSHRSQARARQNNSPTFNRQLFEDSVDREETEFNTDQLAVIRSGDWKLMTGPIGFNGIVPNPDTDLVAYMTARSFKNSNSAVRLFNIRNDPTEANNLRAERPDIVRELIEKLARHERTALPAFYPSTSDECRPQPYGNIRVWGPYSRI
ncbi:arylsulfatase B-like isoform X2 [Watersipora subatra]|uniref:arylsulfatase B-like isoform X2 n=1 Tax=Watersipora subatra TaxID=2589382 RepID=UPI00355B289D